MLDIPIFVCFIVTFLFHNPQAIGVIVPFTIS